MRLGQLGRKLSLRPAEIVEFLASNNIQIGSGSNTRIEDEYALLVIKHFAPGQENLLKEEQETEASGNFLQEPSIAEPQAPTVPEVTKEITEELQTPQAETFLLTEKEERSSVQATPIPVSLEKDEIIKAPKVELPGLKVLGKIELPEPKKKEEETSNEVPVENVEGTDIAVEQQPKKTPREDRKPAYQKRDRSDFRPRKNPIALQREREALEAERRRKEELEREKERRTQNYLKKVKIVQPTKAAKLVKEDVIEMNQVEDEKPKSWWGKIIRWLTHA